MKKNKTSEWVMLYWQRAELLFKRGNDNTFTSPYSGCSCRIKRENGSWIFTPCAEHKDKKNRKKIEITPTFLKLKKEELPLKAKLFLFPNPLLNAKEKSVDATFTSTDGVEFKRESRACVCNLRRLSKHVCIIHTCALHHYTKPLKYKKREWLVEPTFY